jgi:hypothetical protein
MSLPSFPTTATIMELFEEEVSAAGGVVSNSFDDGTRLFVRSIFPQTREVQPSDKVQGGVALRAGATEIWVHPYVFRQVCTNGAIMAQAIQSRHIECPEFATEYEVADAVRLAIRECSAEKVFELSTEQIRSARDIEADLALNMLSMFSTMRPSVATHVLLTNALRSIMERFFGDADRSRFGLMNAITSVARDSQDPEMRWRLEELGGGIPVSRAPKSPTKDTAARRHSPAERTRDMVAV